MWLTLARRACVSGGPTCFASGQASGTVTKAGFPSDGWTIRTISTGFGVQARWLQLPPLTDKPLFIALPVGKLSVAYVGWTRRRE